jgi:formiminoglutamate deiminase
MHIYAKRAYLENGWAQNVRLTITGVDIIAIETNATAHPADTQVDTLLPAMSNLHSHSFQRAMVGMTEFRTKGRESFWTWRELMYAFLDQLTPDHISAIAALAFMEMQKSGYAAVGEFHYIHNAQGGQTYDDPVELSTRIMQAASETGIGLTHLPVLYSHGDIGEKPLNGGQLRFGNSVEDFVALVERCKTDAAILPSDTVVGIAPHSLRATSPSDLSRILEQTPDGPIHIHIAEQIKEVDAVKATLGARPVEWLLNNADVNARWCLIHATHMTETETLQMARTGAVAGLCPVTEANLGDGIFNGKTYLNADGIFGVGTDSNVNISLTEELRLFEYSQRLHHRERNVLAPEDGSTGQRLYTAAAKGTAQALGRNAGSIATGTLADLVAINSNDPRLCALSDDQLFDGFIFAANDTVVTDLWSAGRHAVQNGQHIAEDRIIHTYRHAIADLTASLNTA